jgi:hypothetical protein
MARILTPQDYGGSDDVSLASDHAVPTHGAGGFIRYGMSAGVVAGLLTSIVMMAFLYFEGQGFWTLLSTISVGWFGPRALQGGSFVLLAGELTLLVYALIWGACYGWLVGQGARPFAARLMVGLLVSLVAWTVTTYLVIPAANPMLGNLAESGPLSWFAGFFVFGAFLSFAPVMLHDQDPDHVTEPDPRMV